MGGDQTTSNNLWIRLDILKDYMDNKGFWGYTGGQHDKYLAKGHTKKPIKDVKHHENWFPYQSYGSKGKGNKNSLIINFNGPTTKIIPHKEWEGTEIDLYKIYLKTRKTTHREICHSSMF